MHNNNNIIVIIFCLKGFSLQKFEKALSRFVGEIPDAAALFINSSLSCSSSSLTFSSTLTYSSDDGSLTATDLINRINSQLTSAPVSVNGIQLHVMEMSSDRTTTMTSLLVGLFLGGFGSSALIWLIVIVIIL